MGGLLRRVSKAVVEGVADLVFPQFCSGCNKQIKNNGELLCKECLEKMEYVYPPSGRFLHYVTGPVVDYFPRFENIWALTRYTSGSIAAKLVMDAKNHPDKRSSAYVGYLLGASIAEEIMRTDISCIVPSPIMESRAKRRGRSQTEIIAMALGEQTGLSVVNALRNVAKDNVIWHKFLDKTYSKMFRVNKYVAAEEAKELKGKHVLFFDDVITTGVSVSECIRVLHETTGGDMKVSLACVAIKNSIAKESIE